MTKKYDPFFNRFDEWGSTPRDFPHTEWEFVRKVARANDRTAGRGPARASVFLKRLAERHHRRARPARPFPPDDGPRIAALEQRIKALQDELQPLRLRQRARDLAEWLDVLDSPTALRFLAELQEHRERAIRERIEREEREREQREREWQQFYSSWPFRTDHQNARTGDLATMGLPHDAAPEQVRARYSALMMELHPDRRGGDRAGEWRMQMVREAFGRLRDAHRHQPGMNK